MRIERALCWAFIGWTLCIVTWGLANGISELQLRHMQDIAVQKIEQPPHYSGHRKWRFNKVENK